MPRSRDKGYAFEQEAARLWTDAGATVVQLQRNRAGTGDHFIVAGGVQIAQECKRAERLRLQEWWPEAVLVTPDGALTVVTLRWNRGEALSVLRTSDLIQLLTRRSDEHDV